MNNNYNHSHYNNKNVAFTTSLTPGIENKASRAVALKGTEHIPAPAHTTQLWPGLTLIKVLADVGIVGSLTKSLGCGYNRPHTAIRYFPSSI